MDQERNDFLNLADLEARMDQDLLDRCIQDGKVFHLDFTLGSVGSTNNPGDIASDYMDASYFGEQLGKFCSAIEVSTINGNDNFGKYTSFVRFILTPSDALKLLAELRRLAPGFAFDDEPDTGIRDEVADFEDGIFEAKLRLPELADNYMANFLAGDSYAENTEYWNARLPMARLGYWRSFASPVAGCEFYTTSGRWDGVWIVIADRKTTEKLLAEYGGFTSTASKLQVGTSIRLNNFPHILVTPSTVTQVSPQLFDNALACLRRYIAPSLVQRHPEARDQWLRYVQRPRLEFDRWLGFSWAMTEDGEAITCGNQQITLVAFNQSRNRLRPEVLPHILADSEQSTDAFRSLLGLNSVQLTWNILSPEQFEDLCYDILLRSGRFDERTIRKHGKTRSRDGGRDIEVWTLPRLNVPSEKWIFQCKFISNGSALSGTKVMIADVVDQYDAKGFGVMTNEVIDSTLYDKLDAITDRRKIGRETWDGRRLQRFLAAREDLMKRHFPARRNLT